MPLHTAGPRGCSCQAGAECGSPGKHPRLRHGLLDASTHTRLIHSWWRRWPIANVGLVTGTVIDICDIDSDEGLRTVLDALGTAQPPGPVVRTGHGWHLWFAATGLPSRVGFASGVDWRGRGGSAVAPPSLHASGTRYAFTHPWHGGPLPACPPALRQLIAPPPQPTPVPGGPLQITDLDRYSRAALDGEIERVLSAPRPVFQSGRRVRGGGRNNALNQAAFRLGQLAARGGLDRSIVWPRLTDAAVAAGLHPAEARRTIASGWRAGLRHPRR